MSVVVCLLVALSIFLARSDAASSVAALLQRTTAAPAAQSFIVGVRAVSDKYNHPAPGCLKTERAGSKDVLTRLPLNLNDNGGDNIFLCVDRVQNPRASFLAPVGKLMAHATEQEKWQCPLGWEPVGRKSQDKMDFNHGAGGPFVYVCAHSSSDKQNGPAITDIQVVAGPCPKGFTDVPSADGASRRVNLNHGAGGPPRYLCYTTVNEKP